MKPTCRFEDLQLYAYGFLEGAEKAVVESHLEGCPECRAALEDLWAERQIVTFELSLDSGTTDALPLPPAADPRSEARKGRLLRLVLPLSSAAAALLVIAVALWSYLSPVEPGGDSLAWTRLADGTRFCSADGAEVEQTRPRSLRLDRGSLTIEVSGADRAFTIETPHGLVTSDGGRIEVRVGADGTRVEVLAGDATFRPGPFEDTPAPPGAFGNEWMAALDSAPGLIAFLLEISAENEELRKRIDDLVARLERSPESPAPADPQTAVEEYDWAALVKVLAELTPDLRRGRLPRDVRVLRKYLEQLERLGDLSRLLGMGASVAEAARDPRTGPRMFAAALANAWPDASEADLREVESEVARLLEDHAAKEVDAETPAEKAALEEGLRKDLARQVEVFEAKQDSAATSVRPVNTDQGGSGGETGPEETDEPVRDSDTGTQAPSSSQGVQRVLVASGFSTAPQRVFRGSESQVLALAAKAWVRDLGLSDRMVADLERIAWRWLEDYRGKLLRADPRVVEALEAGLAGRAASADVPASRVLELRAALLTTQAVAEAGVYDLMRRSGIRVPADPVSVPTFFLVTR